MNKKIAKFRFGLIVILFGVINFVTLYDYHANINTQLDIQAISFLSQRSEMAATIVNDEFDNQFRTLTALTHVIGRNNYDSTEIEILLRTFNDNNSAQRITYINEYGTGFTADGFELDISDRDYFHECLRDGQTITYVRDSHIDSEPKIILCKAIYDNGQPIGLLASIYDNDSINRIFRNLDHEVYVLLANSNGDVLININRYQSDFEISNIFDFYHSVSNYDDNTLNQIRVDLIYDNSGVITISQDGQKFYISYFAISNTDWTVFTAIPHQTVWSQYEVIRGLSMGLFARGFLIFSLALLFIYYIEYKKRLELEKERVLLRRSEERYRLLDELTQSMIIEGDFLSDTITFSDNHQTLFGEVPLMTNISTIINNDNVIIEEDLTQVKKFVDDLRKGTTSATVECRFKIQDDKTIWAKITGISLRDDKGEVIGFLAKIVNRDEQIKEIRSLKEAASRDSLTKIDNRESIEIKINDYVIHRYQQKEISAFFVIDMDNFKEVNDKQGHLVGDRLLVETASTLRRLFRKTDYVGRLGGDEFAIFMNDVASVKDIEEKARELMFMINDDIKRYNIDNRLSCCIGIAIAYNNIENFDDLYQRADKALYKAKANGKNQYVIDNKRKGKTNGRV